MIFKKVLPVFALVGALWMPSAWAGEGQVYKLQVNGLACPFCAYGLEKALKRVGGVEGAKVDLAQGVAVVTTADGAIFDRETARQVVRRAGFTLRRFQLSERVAAN